MVRGIFIGVDMVAVDGVDGFLLRRFCFQFFMGDARALRTP